MRQIKNYSIYSNRQFSWHSWLGGGVLFALFCLLFLGHPQSSLADQNDPRLDELFAQLLAVDDETAGDQITGNIWTIWRNSDDAVINDLMLRGTRAMSQGRFSHSLDYFNEIIARAPTFAEGWNKRATVYYFMGEFKKSVADIEETLRLEPRHFGAIAGWGLIHLARRQYNEALTSFKKALAVNPHLPGPKIQVERLEELLAEDPV